VFIRVPRFVARIDPRQSTSESAALTVTA